MADTGLRVGMEIEQGKETRNRMAEANETKDGGGSVNPHRCDACDREFPDFQTFSVHKSKWHTKKSVPCSMCSKIFLNAKYLGKHMATFHSGKEFGCKECRLKFVTEGYYKAHMGKYHGKKSNECAFCDAKFITITELKKHRAEVHPKAMKTSKKHECPHCKRLFCSSYLSSHVAICAHNKKV